ncbi:MAG: hypothetical protein A3E87_01665 [Gammaproteobacteria bacterium RIFCSPHIGHO2_12_FULL_35_23]|nr:MAG: hypothetical protein A3E87_01665 [Gammaproteobacteria bacterium RIFCSPHIGHO2_12_FULL_35_23]
MAPKKEWQENLPRLKKYVEDYYKYWRENYDYFNKMMRFIYDTTLDSTALTVLNELGKPPIEFNIMCPFIDRQRGEFAKQEPSFKICGKGGKKIDPALLDFLEGHFREIQQTADNRNFQYRAYSESLGGGYSIFKGWIDYENDRSFKRVIKIGKCENPTLVGFDVLAQLPDKTDGRVCFELYPKTKEEIELEYGVDIKDINFSRSMGSFNWSYSVGGEDVALVCEMFEKKKERVRLVEIATGQTMTLSEYKKFVAKWEASGKIEAVPVIKKGKSRWSTRTTICRYIFIENQVIDYEETTYKSLSLRFLDGNSQAISNESNSERKQKVRSYCHNSVGLQQLKNFAGQTLANELENMVQHKFKVAIESIPDQPNYQKAYENVQIQQTLVYNSRDKNDPTITNPPPEEIARVPAPPEVMNTFVASDNGMQVILGAYDASLGINDNQLSGVAMIEGATQSNATAMPHLVGYLDGLTSLFQWVLEMIPQVYIDSMHLPYINSEGERDYQLVNAPGGINLNYDPEDLEINVTAGVNFQVQKSRALQMMTSMMQASPQFASFINSPEGMPILLDNLEIYGADRLRDAFDKYQERMDKQQPQVPPEVQIKQMEVQQRAQQSQADNQIKMAQVQNDQVANENERMKIMLQAEAAHRDDVVEMAKAHAETFSKSADLAMKQADQDHRHVKEALELHHTLSEGQL